jgi:hypothetical protein
VDNFFAEVTFIVPYNTGVGAWDFGFAFRFIEDEGRQYWLVIQSDGDWFLRLFFNNEPTLVQEGQLNNLNLEAGSENVLALIADGDRGIFFVNDVYITDLDLGALLIPGNLAVGVGFINDHEVEGYATTYRDFTVRALP